MCFACMGKNCFPHSGVETMVSEGVLIGNSPNFRVMTWSCPRKIQASQPRSQTSFSFPCS